MAPTMTDGAPIHARASRSRSHGFFGLGLLVLVVTFLPFARGALLGEALFFRDLSQQFFPIRRFVVEGLRSGEVRFWDPYVHEGEPVFPPPISYPLDLLQVLLPNEPGFSLLLVLHVPLAALGFLLLCRELGVSAVPAAVGASIYALGGICLSSVSLYLVLQAIAWAPLVVLGLWRAARGGAGDFVLSSLLGAVALSTIGVEFVGQAVLLGLVLGFSRQRPWGGPRAAASLLPALALTAPSLELVHQLTQASRAQGISTSAVLHHSAHPVMLIQVLIANLFGDLSALYQGFTGYAYTGAFPYFPSLYLGAAALALAILGIRSGAGIARRIAILASLFLLLCLGRHVGLAAVVDLIPPGLRLFRHPVKAFFTVHFSVALLAALGMDGLLRAEPHRWRRLGRLALGLGGALLLVPVVLGFWPSALAALAEAFYPASLPAAARLSAGRAVLLDAGVGALPALLLGLVAMAVAASRISPGRGAAAALALVCLDLLRAGAGLNPTVAPSFYELSPEMAPVTDDLRRDGGRVFTCEPEFSVLFQPALATIRTGQDVWVSSVYLESLAPFFNVDFSVPSAYSLDSTMLVEGRRQLSRAECSCHFLDAVLGRLRVAGVAFLLSFAPLDHPDLELEATAAPRRVAPLRLWVYRLRDAWPLRFVAAHAVPARDRLEATALSWLRPRSSREEVAIQGLESPVTGATGRIVSFSQRAGERRLVVEADRKTVVVLRESDHPGWRARVDGRAAPILVADGRHMAVAVPAGRSTVELSFRPPGMRGAFVLSFSSAFFLAAILLGTRRRRAAREPRPADGDGAAR
jgi:hypothetical protein